MNTIRTLCRLAVLVAAVSAALLGDAGPVSAQGGAERFKQGCVKGCMRAPGHKEICDRQCDCIISVLREDGNTTPFGQLEIPQAEMKRLNLICTGQVGVTLMTETCNEHCQADTVCRQTCACLSAKIRENRTREEIGTFFNALATSAEALSQLENACAKP